MLAAALEGLAAASEGAKVPLSVLVTSVPVARAVEYSDGQRARIAYLDVARIHAHNWVPTDAAASLSMVADDGRLCIAIELGADAARLLADGLRARADESTNRVELDRA
jgi:hypothetical protein